MWLPIAIVAQVILGTSAVFDKVLLKRSVFNPAAYTFWLGILGIFAVFLLPFGVFGMSLKMIVVALVAGALFLLAMLFLFMSLHKSEASKSLLLIGGITPVTTLVIASFLPDGALLPADIVGFVLLVIGGFVLFFSEEKELRGRIALYAIASAICFGISNTLTKHAFSESSFFAGFFWVKIGGVLFVASFLLFPTLRRALFSTIHRDNTEHHTLYLLNRGYAAAGSILVNVAIFLAHPALVEATQGLKYVVIFLASWLVLHEHFKGTMFVKKMIAMVLVVLGLLWMTFAEWAHNIPVNEQREITWGVTFSQKFSKGIGLDWQENFSAIINDLHPTTVRLIVYWDDSEKQKGSLDFSDTDWMLAQLKNTNTKAVLSFGMKAPRWPECHIPSWAQGLETDAREAALAEYIRAVVEHYRGDVSVSMWQLENEPYLAFGTCPQRGDNFLEHEVALVRSLDPSRSILTTDGGEFGTWYKAARNGDVFGTTMYRRVYPRVIGPLFGVVEYPLAPSYFKVKDRLIHWIIGDPAKRFIVIELQGEPWGPKPIDQLSDAELEAIFSPAYFYRIIDYAKQTGFDAYYLWGSEWWYWRKIHGDERYWDIVEELMVQNAKR